MSKIWYAPNQHQAYDEEEIQAVVNCLRDGWLVAGPRVELFERKVADLFGRRYGTMTNSGSSANLLALAVLGLGGCDEVVTPACTFATTAAPILQVGARPMFVDVAPGRLVPSVEQVLEACTEKTKAILIPDLVGDRFDWNTLRYQIGHRYYCVQDSCDTIGLPAIDADLVTTSFYASHTITTGGAGGMVMTDIEGVRRRLDQYRDWGRAGDDNEDYLTRFDARLGDVPFDSKFLYEVLGFNFRPTEMQAAFGLVQLQRLTDRLAQRRKNVNLYRELLAGTPYLFVEDKGDNHWLAMPLRHPERQRVLIHLEQHDVQTRMLMAGNITRHPAYRRYCKPFPQADQIMREGFLVGAHHGMDETEVRRVCRLLKEVA